MIRSAITICLVEESRGGPFVFHNGLADGCRHASELGFDAVEIFAPGPQTIHRPELHKLLKEHNLKVAAVGTGAGWVRHKWSLTSPQAEIREKARQFIRDMISFGGEFGAPAIIGSMQGRWGDGVEQSVAVDWLRGALQELGDHASQYHVPLIYEPLNRYETNMANTVEAGLELLKGISHLRVQLLADLFHMNLEEADIAAALRKGGPSIGHVHFVDSNRRAAGLGHLNFNPIAAALREIHYQGYVSAEAFPLPDPLTAARSTISAYRHLFLK